MIKRTITILVLLAACLIGVCMAEPQPVDGGWHRSDEVPAETPTAAPTDGEQHSADEEQAPSRVDADAAVTTAAEPQPRDVVMEPEVAERQMDVGGLVAVGLCGLLALTALWCCLRWGRYQGTS